MKPLKDKGTDLIFLKSAKRQKKETKEKKEVSQPVAYLPLAGCCVR
jgi:hypothetical protein